MLVKGLPQKEGEAKLSNWNVFVYSSIKTNHFYFLNLYLT